MSIPLLTIGIPTYKRAELLDLCLHHMLPQITDDIKDRVEIIISDNASPDNTTEVVNKHIALGYSIQYIKNPENIGADRNIAACFLKAKGKYVWVFSDDDFIFPGRLRQIFDLLDTNDLGNIFVNTLSYSGEYVAPSGEQLAPVNYTIYNDPIDFVERINYWSTFITGNIFNKSLFSNYDYINNYYTSLLVQLTWSLPIMFAGKPNAVINDQMVACLANNTGSYSLYQVFGKNYNDILDKLIGKKLIDKRAKTITNKHLLTSFFPMFFYNPTFKSEGALKILTPIYWRYSYFWLTMVPALLKQQIKKRWLKK